MIHCFKSTAYMSLKTPLGSHYLCQGSWCTYTTVLSAFIIIFMVTCTCGWAVYMAWEMTPHMHPLYLAAVRNNELHWNGLQAEQSCYFDLLLGLKYFTNSNSEVKWTFLAAQLSKHVCSVSFKTNLKKCCSIYCCFCVSLAWINTFSIGRVPQKQSCRQR